MNDNKVLGTVLDKRRLKELAIDRIMASKPVQSGDRFTAAQMVRYSGRTESCTRSILNDMANRGLIKLHTIKGKNYYSGNPRANFMSSNWGRTVSNDFIRGHVPARIGQVL